MRGWSLIPLLIISVSGCLADEPAVAATDAGPSDIERPLVCTTCLDDHDTMKPGPDGIDQPVACRPCHIRVSTAGRLWEPHVVADPLRPDHVVAVVGDGGFIAYISDDAGGNWTRHDILADHRAPGGAGADWATTGDPAVAFLPDGSFVVVGLGTAQQHARTPDGGSVATVQTRRDVWSLHVDMDGATSDFGIIARSNGTLLLFPAGGASPGFEMPDREFVAADADGNLIATWSVLSQADPTPQSYYADLRMATSNDAGATWSDPVAIGPDARVKGALPFFLDGRAVVAHGSYGDPALYITAGPDWHTTRLGPGDAAPHAATASDGRAAIATIADDNGTARAALYEYQNGTWVGPRFVGAPTAGAEHVAVALVGNETWVGWYDAATEPRYVVTRVGDTDWVDLDIEVDMVGPARGYGDYVFGLNPHPDGGLVTYVAGDAEGRWLHHAVLRFTQA